MNRLPAEIVETLRRLFEEGYSTRAAARVAGVSKLTAWLYLRNMPDLNCPCGRPMAGHRGWCSFRFSRSPARQKFMRQWHKNSPKQRPISRDHIGKGLIDRNGE